jgi:N6-L-threonylcarbamoyladenine synthase
MKILGIETSCDETAAAVIEDGTKIISNFVATSAKLHVKTGGIIPEVAARQQIKSIIPVIKEALKMAKTEPDDIDALAVTIGPGLAGSLLVGVETAKTLSYLWQKPIIPVNHLIGHIYANWLETGSRKNPNPAFPALALVVSGGHSDLVLMRHSRMPKWLGGTRDDAAGEAFDKCARLLGLGYPGGPAISAAAEKFQASNPNFQLKLFPRPLINEDNFDFSFSGLKTAVAREVQGQELTETDKEKLAAEVQEAIIDVLVAKSVKAVEKLKPQSFLLAGGVAANQRLREKLESKIKNKLFVPQPKLCTDNATFIAAAAFFQPEKVNWQKLAINPQLTINQAPI